MVVILIIGIQVGNGQVQCVQCFAQNDALDPTSPNMVQNGSFEMGSAVPSGFFCPNSFLYSGDISNWLCTGGGTSTYAQILDNLFSQVPDGSSTAYLGNAFSQTCSMAIGDTSCLITTDCTVTGIPNGYPNHDPEYGGSTGVSLSQTVQGLTIGNSYTLEFWAGGEDFFTFNDPGIFAVDIGFGNILLHCMPTNPGDIGTRYAINFIASATTHTITFTNWGHTCYTCSEVILDDVKLYPSTGATSTFNVISNGCDPLVQLIGTDPTATYNWQLGNGDTAVGNTVTYTYPEPGNYVITATVTGASCGGTQTFSQPISIAAPTILTGIFTVDQCNGRNVVTTNMGPDSSSVVYTWTMGDGTVLFDHTVEHEYATDGDYTITLEALDTLCGTMATTSLDVSVNSARVEALSIPNVFSPDKDGNNEVFFPIEGVTNEVNLKIWNRFGNLVHDSGSSYTPWNGKVDGENVPEGVYFYSMEYRFKCGTGVRQGFKNGHVQLLRNGR